MTTLVFGHKSPDTDATLSAIIWAWYLTNRHQRERTALQSALADAVDSLRSAVRSGMSVEEALASLARHGPEVLRPPLTDLARDLRVSGFEEAIRRTREQVADPVFDMVAAALLMSHPPLEVRIQALRDAP